MGTGDGNGVHWQNENVGNGTWNVESHKPLGHTPAATIVTGFSSNSRVWRLHEDLKVSVQCDDGSWYTTPHTDSDRRAEAGFLDAQIQELDVSRTAKGTIQRLVTTDSKKNIWNLRYGGHHGMIVGYAGYYHNPSDIDTAKQFAVAVAKSYDLKYQTACDAVEYAFERVEERNLGGYIKDI